MEFKDFEKSLKRLEEIVAKLEEGELTLEESLKLFEEGTKLSKSCGKQLNQAQRKVEMLVKNENNESQEVPFSTNGEPEQ